MRIADTEMIELHREIELKRREMLPEAPTLKAILRALVREAADTYKQLARFDMAFGGSYPCRQLHGRNRTGEYFEKLVAFVESNKSSDDLVGIIREAGLIPSQLPSPESVRRLRVITETIPVELVPFKYGAADSQYALWQIMWLHALGAKAGRTDKKKKSERHRRRPPIADAIHGIAVRALRRELYSWNNELFSKGEIEARCAKIKPVGRQQIFRILDESYAALAAKLESHLDMAA